MDKGGDRRNPAPPEPSFPGVESGTGVLAVKWTLVTGSQAYFGFLVRGHSKEGEENTPVQVLLHVSNLRGWGHPLIKLSGYIVQVGVQALLQGLIKDNLSQVREESKD